MLYKDGHQGAKGAEIGIDHHCAAIIAHKRQPRGRADAQKHVELLVAKAQHGVVGGRGADIWRPRPW